MLKKIIKLLLIGFPLIPTITFAANNFEVNPIVANLKKWLACKVDHRYIEYTDVKYLSHLDGGKKLHINKRMEEKKGTILRPKTYNLYEKNELSATKHLFWIDIFNATSSGKTVVPITYDFNGEGKTKTVKLIYKHGMDRDTYKDYLSGFLKIRSAKKDTFLPQISIQNYNPDSEQALLRMYGKDEKTTTALKKLKVFKSLVALTQTKYADASWDVVEQIKNYLDNVEKKNPAYLKEYSLDPFVKRFFDRIGNTDIMSVAKSVSARKFGSFHDAYEAAIKKRAGNPYSEAFRQILAELNVLSGKPRAKKVMINGKEQVLIGVKSLAKAIPGNLVNELNASIERLYGISEKYLNKVYFQNKVFVHPEILGDNKVLEIPYFRRNYRNDPDNDGYVMMVKRLFTIKCMATTTNRSLDPSFIYMLQEM